MIEWIEKRPGLFELENFPLKIQVYKKFDYQRDVIFFILQSIKY